MRELEEEMGERVRLEWKSFLLRPHPADPPRTLEQFRRYTESWLVPREHEPRAELRVWSTEEGPPSHSVPPHLISKAAARLDRESGESRWDALHWALLEAYFRDNRDITSEAVLTQLWNAAGYPTLELASEVQQELAEEIVADHREAVEHGASGVPAVRRADRFGVVMGAQPLAAYRQWVERSMT